MPLSVFAVKEIKVTGKTEDLPTKNWPKVADETVAVLVVAFTVPPKAPKVPLLKLETPKPVPLKLLPSKASSQAKVTSQFPVPDVRLMFQIASTISFF